MTLSDLLTLLNDIADYRTLAAALNASPPRLPDAPLGVLAAARPTVLAGWHAHVQRPLVVLVARADRARALAQQLCAWSPHPEAVLRLPDPDALPYERVAWGRDTIRERVSALEALTTWPRTLPKKDKGEVRDEPRTLPKKDKGEVRDEPHALSRKDKGDGEGGPRKCPPPVVIMSA